MKYFVRRWVNKDTPPPGFYIYYCIRIDAKKARKLLFFWALNSWDKDSAMVMAGLNELLACVGCGGWVLLSYLTGCLESGEGVFWGC